jgi:hypothetical protein
LSCENRGKQLQSEKSFLREFQIKLKFSKKFSEIHPTIAKLLKEQHVKFTSTAPPKAAHFHQSTAGISTLKNG